MFKSYSRRLVRKQARFSCRRLRKKGGFEAGSICGDIVDRSQSRSLEQLMDQDSINIDNGENQANKRARGILLVCSSNCSAFRLPDTVM